jgi:hypothetical protein
MATEPKHTAFHWPDHTIGKRESRYIREAHNALYNDFHDLLAALKGLFEHCAMTHKYWGDNCNLKEANAAEQAAREAIKQAEKGE